MVRPLGQIDQDLEKLNQAVAQLAEGVYAAYVDYRKALAAATRQQFVLACYHLCTNSYPEQFLRLSLSDRQSLQQTLRQLAKQTQIQLAEPPRAIEPIRLALLPRALPTSESSIEEEESQEEADSDEQEEEDSALLLSEMLSDALGTPVTAIEVSEAELSEALSNVFSEGMLGEMVEQTELFSSTENAAPEERPLRPRDIHYWQKQQERSFVETLQNLSHAANRALQEAGILPKQLPEPVLEVAAKADLTAETTTSPPNLLSLLVETETDQKKATLMTPVMAIRLRLAEIEFADAALSVWRSRMRDLSARLSQLNRQYQKVQREKAIAEAETAWRSSWFED
jgi:hypothetical protein